MTPDEPLFLSFLGTRKELFSEQRIYFHNLRYVANLHITFDHGHDLGYSDLVDLFDTCFPDEIIDEIIFENNRDRENFIVSRLNSTVVGYLLSSRVGSYASLNQICVDPAHRGKRIGQHLLDQFISLMRQKKMDEIGLFVEIGNYAAIQLYRKFGFVTSSHYYQYDVSMEDIGSTQDMTLELFDIHDMDFVSRKYTDLGSRVHALINSKLYHIYKVLDHTAHLVGIFIIDRDFKLIDPLILDHPDYVFPLFNLIKSELLVRESVRINLDNDGISKYLEQVEGVTKLFELYHMSLILD